MVQPNTPRAFHVMTKPIGPICNLDCEYCFYLDKEKLYPETRSFRMTDEILENYVKQLRHRKSTKSRLHGRAVNLH